MNQDGIWSLDDYLATPLFEGVAREKLTLITDDMRREYGEGAYLLRHQQAENAMFVISNGRVELCGYFNGHPQRIGWRGPREIVGEQSIVNETGASADVIAVERVSALRIPEQIVNELKTDPIFAWNMAKALSDKLREATRSRSRNMREQKLLFAHFRSHVPPELVDELLNRGDEAGTPRKLQAIVMFTDLRNFTRLSGELGDPFRIAAELEPYFETVVDLIHEAKGIVDKFIGDAVMAVWGHPSIEQRTPDDIFQLVLDLRERVRLLTFAGEQIHMGLGVESGTVFMGNVGNKEKRSFTVYGSPVNLASRYESANKDKDGTVYAATFGPNFYAALSPERRATLLTRENVEIKGALDDQQTVYSMKDDDNGLEPQ